MIAYRDPRHRESALEVAELVGEWMETKMGTWVIMTRVKQVGFHGPRVTYQIRGVSNADGTPKNHQMQVTSFLQILKTVDS